MPVVRSNDKALFDSDDEDTHRKHRYTQSIPATSRGIGSNATGHLIDLDDGRGEDVREKVEMDEQDYTRLQLDDDRVSVVGPASHPR